MNDEIQITKALTECERVIERGMQSFVEVGNALLKIRDERLYRLTHDTFEAYCRERWKWGRHYVNRQIAAAEVVQNLVPMGTKPETERQARELAGLPAEKQRQIWAAAIQLTANGKQPTARQIAALTGEPLPPSPTEARRMAVETGESVLDSEGWYQPPITIEAQEAFHAKLDLLDLILGFPESELLKYTPAEVFAKFAEVDWPHQTNKLRHISLDSFINWLKE